jgi:hypothetical protein
MKKFKKIFTTENIKVFFAFMVVSMLITLGSFLFLVFYFDTISALEGIEILKSAFWYHLIIAETIYSLVLYGIIQILFLFEKNR